MTRAPLNYAEPGAVAAPSDGFDPDTPIAGHYRMRLRSGGVFVGIRIWYGAPLDPLTGEELDRSPRWQAMANERPIDLDRVWPRCAASPIDETEYRYLTHLQNWSQQNVPESPHSDPRRTVNMLTAPTPF